jgi:hypothetical protein
VTAEVVAELRAHLKEARRIAAGIPYAQDVTVTLDDLLEDIDFLAAATEAEARP